MILAIGKLEGVGSNLYPFFMYLTAIQNLEMFVSGAMACFVNFPHGSRGDAVLDSIVPTGVESVVGFELPVSANVFGVRQREHRSPRALAGWLAGCAPHRPLPPMDRTGLRPRTARLGDLFRPPENTIT